MLLLGLVFVLVSCIVLAVVGTVRAVATDGYGRRPDRDDRSARTRPI